MACDPNTLMEAAKCFERCFTGDMYPAAEIVLLCAILDGTTPSCDPAALAIQASCIRNCIPLGMMPAVKLYLLCQIANL